MQVGLEDELAPIDTLVAEVEGHVANGAAGSTLWRTEPMRTGDAKALAGVGGIGSPATQGTSRGIGISQNLDCGCHDSNPTVGVPWTLLACCPSSNILIRAGCARGACRLALEVVVATRRARRRRIRAYRAEGARWADHALLDARHHIERHVLVGPAGARQRRSGALCAVVPTRADRAARGALHVLIRSRLAPGARGGVGLRVVGAGRARRRLVRAHRAEGALWADHALLDARHWQPQRRERRVCVRAAGARQRRRRSCQRACAVT